MKMNEILQDRDNITKRQGKRLEIFLKSLIEMCVY